MAGRDSRTQTNPRQPREDPGERQEEGSTPGGLWSRTASHTLIFRMKARSSCSTCDSRESELEQRGGPPVTRVPPPASKQAAREANQGLQGPL